MPEVKKRVAAETEHTIEFVEGYGGSIAGVAETLEAVQNGILDIGAYCFCFEPAKLFLHNFPYYAPFGPQDSAQQMQATRAVYDKTPWLTETFEKEYKQKLLGLHGWDNYHLGTTDPWDTVEDLKGVKVGGAGPNLPWLEFAGAVPVQSTLPDGYLSLQTGVYNGWLMFPSAYLGFKFYEPAPHYTQIGFGAMGVNGLTMNLRKFNSLPPEVQKILVEGWPWLRRTGRQVTQRAPGCGVGWSCQGWSKNESSAGSGKGWLGKIPSWFPKPSGEGCRWPWHARHGSNEKLYRCG